jgi:hypothetical protein
MSKVKIKPFNVIDHTNLPEITVDRLPVDGDPLKIDREMYYVCETKSKEKDGLQEIGVIPLVVKNPAKVQNIKSYIDCLSIAHRRIQFRKNNNICDLNDCDEMIISLNQDINE